MEEEGDDLKKKAFSKAAKDMGWAWFLVTSLKTASDCSEVCGALEPASGGSAGGGWGVSALAMGRLHRSPPPSSCAQGTLARALCIHHLFGSACLPLHSLLRCSNVSDVKLFVGEIFLDQTLVN